MALTLRQVMHRLPPDGGCGHAIREFDPKCGRHPPPSVKQLAESLGFLVELVSPEPGQATRLVEDFPASLGCGTEVNGNNTAGRGRRTVRHEIGHGLLHRDHVDPLFGSRGDRSDMAHTSAMSWSEPQADAFAAAVLFGDGALECACLQLGTDPSRLADRFGVSIAAVRIALRRHHHG